MFKRIKKIYTDSKFRLWKAAAISLCEKSQDLLSYPLLAWLEFQAEDVYEAQGLKAAQNAFIAYGFTVKDELMMDLYRSIAISKPALYDMGVAEGDFPPREKLFAQPEYKVPNRIKEYEGILDPCVDESLYISEDGRTFEPAIYMGNGLARLANGVIVEGYGCYRKVDNADQTL